MAHSSRKNTALLGLTFLFAIAAAGALVAAISLENWLYHKSTLVITVVSHVSLIKICPAGDLCTNKNQTCGLLPSSDSCKLLEAGLANLFLAIIGIVGIGAGAFIYLLLFLLDKRHGCCARVVGPTFVAVGTVAAGAGLIQWSIAAANFMDGNVIPYQFSIGFILDIVGPACGALCVITAFF